MAASDSHDRFDTHPAGAQHPPRTLGERGRESAAEDERAHRRGATRARQLDCLSAQELADRLEEEINRAGRHGTPLSCLLVAIDDLAALASAHGRELPEQALAYAGPVLLRELRRFDRVGRPSESELLVVLPGADGPRGETVARRVIDRLRAIKIESSGVRRPLRVSVGLAAWREDLTGEQLLAQTRAAAQRERDELAALPGSSRAG